MALGRQVIARGNPNAASDGAAGVLAARMAARTAVYNVKINLGSITDEGFTAELRAEADRLEPKRKPGEESPAAAEDDDPLGGTTLIVTGDRNVRCTYSSNSF